MSVQRADCVGFRYDLMTYFHDTQGLLSRGGLASKS